MHYLPLCYHVWLPMMLTFLVVRTRQGGAEGICSGIGGNGKTVSRRGRYGALHSM